MFPPWILTVEWKLIVSFTNVKPKSVKSAKSASKSAKSWDLSLWLSKVFQTKDQWLIYDDELLWTVWTFLSETVPIEMTYAARSVSHSLACSASLTHIANT